MIAGAPVRRKFSKRTFDSCRGCPFLSTNNSACELAPRVDARLRSVGRWSERGHEPPSWCPLRVGPIIVELRT